MRNFLFLPFLLFSISVLAQFSEEKIITACNDCSPTDVFSEDIDGDGKLDILTSSSTNNRISWYRNLGNDLFSPPMIVSNTATRVNAIDASDVDGDGKIDVLAIVSRNVYWYRNDGTGHFSSVKNITRLRPRE